MYPLSSPLYLWHQSIRHSPPLHTQANPSSEPPALTLSQEQQELQGPVIAFYQGLELRKSHCAFSAEFPAAAFLSLSSLDAKDEHEQAC